VIDENWLKILYNNCVTDVRIPCKIRDWKNKKPKTIVFKNLKER
jgi:hypothetical protein